MNTESMDKMTQHRLDWHSGFECRLMISFRKYSEDLTIEREHPLSSEPLRIDFIVIKKHTETKINNDLGRDFRTYNLIEYKNPNDELNIDVLWKCCGYACLYKSYGKTVDEIKANDITVSIIRASKPGKLFRQLRDNNIVVKQSYPGIYKISGIINIPIKIVVIKELQDAELNALSVMTYNVDISSIRKFLNEAKTYTNSGDKRYADAVLQISASVNKRLFDELKGEQDMCEALKELMSDELLDAENKGKSIGIELGVESTNELYSWLFANERGDDVQKATSDADYLNKLFEEYKEYKNNKK